MARDDELLSRARAALAHLPNVKEKRMFGSTAFMVRGKMCISARAKGIMCRIDPALHDAALEHKGTRTVVMRGRQYRGYVYVDAEAVRTKRDLESEWGWRSTATRGRRLQSEKRNDSQAPAAA